ncbi:M23 family metallopeptidase [Actinotalea solisilvae]|uniref:M23 family metallopeptidase n=1 Tax=Actinotalea solisilvae TaxID=2072922 RepID=UPI0018F13314|nr:M23 family metallopeptidase [Actinotalea solisilvae]
MTVLVVAPLLLASAAAASGAPGADDDSARNRAQQESVGLSVAEIDELLEDTDAALVAVYAELEVLNAQVPVAEAELATAQALVDQLQREASILAERLDAAEAEQAGLVAASEADAVRVGDLRSNLGQMARDALKGTPAATTVSVVLGSSDVDDLTSGLALTARSAAIQARTLRQLQEVGGINRNRAARLDAVRDEIAVLKADADATLAAADAARQAAQVRADELAAMVERQQASITALETQRAAQLSERDRYAAQQAALQAELAAIVRAEAEARTAAGPAAAPGAQPAQVGAPPNSAPGPRGGVLAYPSPMETPVITSPYGWRIHPIYGYRKLHAGTDFRAYCGTPIIAAAAGTVQWAKSVGGFGNQVMLNHGQQNGRSLMTSYNHLSTFAVSSGQIVAQGDVVGYSGTTGTSTACHLHFETYVDGTAVDPETLF